MDAGESASRSAGTAPRDRPSFELERFAWASPDRLEVVGKFSGLSGAPPGPAVLVLQGGDQTHRLPASSDEPAGAQDGERWRGAFTWQEAPAPFDVAQLELGRDFVVELPEPGARRKLFRHQVLEVRRVDPAPERERKDGAPADAERPAGDEGGAARSAEPADAGERVRLRAALVEAREEARKAGQALERVQEELARAREDVEAERRRRAEDAERFRQGLASVQQAADEAVAAERSAAAQRAQDLQEATAALKDKDAALKQARGDLAALHERVGKLAQADAEAQRLQSQLQEARSRADETRERLQGARQAAMDARAEAERLLGGLTSIAEKLGDGG